MLRVDNRQLEQGYAPIACGLMVTVVGCALATVVTTLWWFFVRGS